MKFCRLQTWYVFLISPKFHGNWPTVTKPSANKCRSLCKLISNSLHVNRRPIYDGFAMKLRYHKMEWVQWHSSCLKIFGEDWSCHHCHISRGLPKERPRISIAHPGRAWPACGPTKCPTFCWWNVQVIPFNGNAAFWQSLGLWLNLRVCVF